MPSLRKAVVCVLALVAALWAGSLALRLLGPVYANWRLSRALAKIEAWPAAPEYTASAWKRLISAARVFQKSRPEFVETALTSHLNRFATRPEQLAVEQGKVFLLLCMMFELEQEEGAQARSGRASVAVSEGPGGWPPPAIVWQNGKPTLKAGFPGKPLFTQPIADVFTAYRYRYKHRDLSNIKL
ncbi:MAG: hypothetical protein N2379_08200 [Verrucomicrobiae bacterium]|nr:hypothetical protein [Verrucomicrobiae bacterium]